MPKKTWIPLVFAVMAVVVAVLLLRQTDQRPEPQPTRTPVPGFATIVFLGVNEGLSMQRQPTLTPGLSSDALVGTAIQATLVTSTASPTHTPSPSNTSPPTHTLIPSRTPVPGLGTQIFEAVQGTLGAQGLPTFTPGPRLEQLLEQAVQATVTAGYSDQ